MNETNSVNGDKWSPPYTSFKTLMNTISRMAQEGGVPSRIDRSYLSNMPGSVRATFLGSLRSFGLIDEGAKPTDRLIALVDADGDEKRKREMVLDMLNTYYSQAVTLPAMATQSQLEGVFRDYGVSGSTLRKAIAFYLAAARFAGLTISPHFRVPKDPSAGESRQARPRRTAAPTPAASASAPSLGGHGSAASHPLIAGLIRELPSPGEQFPSDKQEAWFAIAKATFTLLYPTGATQSRRSSDDTGGESD